MYKILRHRADGSIVRSYNADEWITALDTFRMLIRYLHAHECASITDASSSASDWSRLYAFAVGSRRYDAIAEVGQ